MKKLSFLIAQLLLAGFTHAQVQYTKVEPEVTLSQTTVGTSTYDIDLNDDDKVDFVVDLTYTEQLIPADGSLPEYTTKSHVAMIYTGSEEPNGEVADIEMNDNFFARSFSATNVISSSLWDINGTLFYYTTTPPLAFTYSGGNFLNSSDKYVGVRFKIGEDTHYGYIVLSATNSTVTVKGFAYENTAGASITAGSGATTNSLSAINLTSKITQINNSLLVELEKESRGKIEVINMNGQLVKSAPVNGVSASVSLSELAAGIYQVLISCDNGITAEKIVVMDK